MNFHRFIIASTSSSEVKEIAPQTDSTSSFFRRLEFEAKSVLAELLSCVKKTRKCLPRATTDTLRLHDLITFSFYFDSKATSKRSLAKLAACVSARGHKDRIFPELAADTITPNLLSDNLGRKSFSSYRSDQSERRRKCFSEISQSLPRVKFYFVLFFFWDKHDFGDRQKGYLFICFLNEASLKSYSLKR